MAPSTTRRDPVAEALQAVLEQARWDDGTQLVDLHPQIVLDRLAPLLAQQLRRHDAMPGEVPA